MGFSVFKRSQESNQRPHERRVIKTLLFLLDAAVSLPPHDAEAAGRQEDEVSCRRRSHRGGDGEDEEQRFLSPGDDVTDEEGLRCVERKCPYCPDRFHNGIGLANHVRGHLNRVGVSYNVRHFISPEEVNAIEKKFSYQKKKKKGQFRKRRQS